MAIYRNISMSFWTDPKVVDDFTPEDRYIYLYCMTNPHTNLCGCYEVSVKQIANETGYNTDTVERLLRRLDNTHNVIRYSPETHELMLLNWHRYNWSRSEKLDKPILEEIKAVKEDNFRGYLAGRYNERDTVSIPYAYGIDTRAGARASRCTVTDTGTVSDTEEVPIPNPESIPKLKERHKYGQYNWVRLTDREYEKLLRDLGEQELTRCIQYIDESAQSNGNKNKWQDWNLVIRKCSREGWGRGRQQLPKKPASDEDYRINGNPFLGRG